MAPVGMLQLALAQWRFKPPTIGGRATEVETGLLIEFGAGGAVAYSTGAR